MLLKNETYKYHPFLVKDTPAAIIVADIATEKTNNTELSNAIDGVSTALTIKHVVW